MHTCSRFETWTAYVILCTYVRVCVSKLHACASSLTRPVCFSNLSHRWWPWAKRHGHSCRDHPKTATTHSLRIARKSCVISALFMSLFVDRLMCACECTYVRICHQSLVCTIPFVYMCVTVNWFSERSFLCVHKYVCMYVHNFVRNGRYYICSTVQRLGNLRMYVRSWVLPLGCFYYHLGTCSMHGMENRFNCASCMYIRRCTCMYTCSMRQL